MDNVIARCHKNRINYCKIGNAMKEKECLEHSAKKLVVGVMITPHSHLSCLLWLAQLKYARMGWERDYCPIWNKKVANWENDGKPQALEFFTQYCATKGKKC